ncbi:hypothetical protein JQ615_25230 [Bradyrhizobium jicamae]|uniref:Uncharacterized protein n=1 Tax=Bradyrhizobium jicamae TaxID=280332 RepID=A0ABS5FPG3_9BRAD|nr:hypothetical protein [Bradyrhizobium jicamae]MBR0798696.1 hypothetical protein [Bradyrhizobium jicamae]MBR0934037.1 hypothetical protein [Bradyrhizobium jicamae]
MPKSSLSNKTTRRPKEPFDPALEAPIALMPDQLETVVGGLVSLAGPLRGVLGTTGIGGATTGVVAPPQQPYGIPSVDKL